MKKFTSILLLIATVLSIFAMSSCSKDDGMPDGMQLVMGGNDDAFCFYAPEEWIASNFGSIGWAHASNIDTTSITFAEAKRPEGSIKDYFKSEMDKLPYTVTVVTDAEECTFGNADTIALKYVYTYKYKTVDYRCMQIFVENNGHFYIFTYTAQDVEKIPETTHYEYFEEKVKACIDAFVFNNKGDAEKPEPTYERTEDGYLIVSDKRICGFTMYVPDSYRVDCSSAFVSVSKDGVNITMSEPTFAAQNESEYWEKRKTDIEAIADKITNENGELVSSYKEITAPQKTDPKNADAAVYCEYSYILDGTTYYTYQLLAAKGTVFGSAYVFTYTCTEDCYQTYFEEMQTIFGKIEF